SDEIRGALFDTTWGFPALSLDPALPTTTVPGTVIWLDPDRLGPARARIGPAPARLGPALAELDRYEGLAHDQYRRSTVVTASGLRCWVYEWIGPVGAFVALSTGWAQWVRSGGGPADPG